MAAPVVPAAAVATTAAALAAAAAAAARAATPPPAPPAPVVNLPAAASASGQTSVAAPIAPAPVAPLRSLSAPVAAAPRVVVPAPVAPVPQAVPAAPSAAVVADDLTLIRAIDGDLQKQLNGLGIKRFTEIAAWKPQDVARAAAALKVPGRIEQENWIEQAQILAKGGETYYSRRKARGETTSSTPTPDEGERVVVRVPATSRPAEPAPVASAAPAAATTVAAAASAAVAAAAVRAAQAASTATATPPVAVASPQPAAVAPPKVADRAAFAAPAAPAAPIAAATVAPAAAADATRAVGLGRDSLQRISGINGEVERLLNVQGVTKYAQVAAWTPSDVARFDRLLGFEGRIRRENWIEQAQILTRGGETAFAREMDRRQNEVVRPNRLADAIRDREAAAVAAVATAATAPAASVLAAAASAVAASAAVEAAPRSELASLRSVRSEAYRGADVAAATVAADQVGARQADDLKRIRGVGVLIEKKLNSLGVIRYEQVANWTVEDIERFSDKLDFKGRIERENWVDQARILSAGGQTEFSRRVDKGEVETSRSNT